MPKSKITPLIQSEEEQANHIIRFLENKKLLLNILYGLILTGLVVGLISQKLGQSKARSASVAYASLDEQNSIQPETNLKLMRKITNKYTHLQPHLDAPLAQECLNQNDLQSSKSSFKRTRSRVSPNLAYIFAFNDVTFLIAEKKYQEALEASYVLKTKIDPAKTPILFAYQLLRIANLEKALGNQTSYQSHLKEFAAFQLNKDQQESLKLGELSLGEFISKGTSLR